MLKLDFSQTIEATQKEIIIKWEQQKEQVLSFVTRMGVKANINEFPIVLFRCFDPWINYNDPKVPHIEVFNILRKTPKGYWIQKSFDQDEKWVPNYGVRRYAYPTIEEAVYSYYKRKQRHITYAKTRYTNVKLCHQVATVIHSYEGEKNERFL